mgnify:CR=1 FL=1
MSFAPLRGRTIGTRHMVSAGHYLATNAAFQILEAGGNAIDAGVSGSIVLSVVQCDFVGFGGVAPIMIKPADQGQVVTVTGLGCWPRRASLDVLIDEYDGSIPHGLLRTVIPAAPDAWLTALKRWGTMSFSEISSAAISLADDGFAASDFLCAMLAECEDDIRQWPENEKIYLPNGRLPKAGERFQLEDLARTIRYMVDEEQAVAAKHGRVKGLQAARDAFYHGDIANTMASYHRTNGGWLREDDLAEFAVEILPPLVVSYKDIDVYTCGPWCQGPVLAQALRLLDGLNIESYEHNSADYIHLIVESLKLSFSDRHHYVGDPNFVDVPMDRLLADDYVNTRRQLISLDEAISGMPPPGLISSMSVTDQLPKSTNLDDVKESTQIDTSYICVVDQRGNMFSSTPSDGMSTAPVIPGLGFVPSSRGAQSWTDPNVPAVMAPGKRPRLTPNPAIAVKGNRQWMPFGSPGNDVQPQAMLQVLLNVFVSEFRLLDALEQPRFATYSFPRSSEPHPYTPDLLKVEGRISESVLLSLKDRGHDASSWPDWDWRAGAVCAIMFDTETGMLEGAADPRRPGSAVGW